jgi:zinc protease
MRKATHISAVVFAMASLSTAVAPATLLAAPGRLPPALVARVEAKDPKIPFEKYQLSNGLSVILAPNRAVPVVAVDVWYHVGSSHETYGKSGFAHLFEHMLFQGSKNVGSDKHFETLKKIGVSDVNGTTNTDRTNYYEVIPSNQLETALWLESDRMGHLLPLVTDESLKNQIDVVRNERRQNYDNRPYGKARFEVAKALYPEGHPYRYLTIGRHEDLSNASLEDVKNFYRTWYVPANATLCISGDFDVDATKKLIEKWFGGFPAATKPVVVAVPAPAQKAADIVVNDEFAKSRQIQFVWHSPANFAPQDAELDLAASALGDEGTGRLYKTLVIEKGLAQNVTAFQQGSTFSGAFNVFVTLSKDADLAEVKRLVLAEVQNMSKTPVSVREYNRTVTGIEAAYVYRLESAFGRAETLQSYNHFVGDPARITWDLDRYRKSNPENVRAAVARYLPTDNVIMVTTMPAATAAAGAKK